jgi:3',5'-cyclic AMP phosphodiesterase CpdA
VSTILQISDAHFGTEQAPVVDALLRLARSKQPDVALFSGDITQRARADQFTAARRFAEALPVPLQLAIPGNHDIPLYNVFIRAFAPYYGYARAFGDQLEPTLELDDMVIACLNTTRRYRHKHGEVSETQIERVAARFARARPDQLRVVVTHQPVHVIRPNDDCNLLRGAEAAVRRWVSAGADVMIGGHIHLPYVRALADRYDGLPRGAWCVQAGTATSRRVRGNIPNSVNLIAYEAGKAHCCVERYDYSQTLDCFERVDTHTLTLDRETGTALTPAAEPEPLSV